MKSVVNEILDELEVLSNQIDQSQIDEVVEQMTNAYKNHHKVFLAGAGRSGCIVRAFANRVMHLGFNCYVVGDITTPPIKENDILFIISGSGKTTSLVKQAEKSVSLGAKIITITLNREGDIAKMACAKIVLPGNTRLASNEGFVSQQPIGSTFEQLAWLTCDGLIMMTRDALGQTNDDLIAHHANLE